MKCLVVILALSCAANCSPSQERPKRSFGHYDVGHYDVGHYDVGHHNVGHYDVGYSTPVHQGTVYGAAVEEPLYTYPVATEVRTRHNAVYNVKVPVTYNYAYQRPLHTTTVYKHASPVVSSPVVSSPVLSSHVSSPTVYSSDLGSHISSSALYGSDLGSSWGGNTW